MPDPKNGFDFLPGAIAILRLHAQEVETHRRYRERHIDTVFDGTILCRDCGEVVAREMSSGLRGETSPDRAVTKPAFETNDQPSFDVPSPNGYSDCVRLPTSRPGPVRDPYSALNSVISALL
jgi:hypothetical protein